MAKDLRFQTMPLAEEYDVGDDSDMPGYAQPITLDDIDAVLNSGRGSVDERRALLASMLDDLRGRQGMDQSGEYGDLIEQLEGGLATLDGAGDGIGTPGSYAFDAADRALQPDEILERQEEEDERARNED